MELILLLLHGSCRLHASVKHLDEVFWISRVRFVYVKTEQVFGDILQVALQNGTPLVSQTQFVQVFRWQLLKINCLGTCCILQVLEQLLLFVFVRCRNLLQIDMECLIVTE